MLADMYNRLREVQRDLEEVPLDGMSKTSGYWFTKGLNKLKQLTVDTETEMMQALGIDSVEVDD
jgi:hypothetical protein